VLGVCSDIETLKTISAACAKNNVVAGMYFQPPGLEPATLIEMGYRFFVRDRPPPRRPPLLHVRAFVKTITC